MKYTMLGSTKIPNIVVGTWSWGIGPMGGSTIFGNHLEETDLKPVFDRALRAGCTLWDTAPVFGMGAAESILGHLAQNRDGVLLSTKFTPTGLQSRHAMEKSLRKSLNRLGTDHLDLFWVHTPKNVKKWTRELIPLLWSGTCRHVGVANHSLEEIQEADTILQQAGLRLAAVQNHYSLLYRVPEQNGILRWCRENNVLFFSYMVLEQGVLTTRYCPSRPLPRKTRRGRTWPPILLERITPLIQTMEEIGQHHQADTAQIAIAWAAAKGTVPVVGITKPHQVSKDAAAVSIALTEEEMLQLERESDALDICIPCYWEKQS